MSTYNVMDHAGWVESNNAACNRMRARKRGYTPLPEKLNDFQAQVADILGMVGGGIYNAPINHEKVEWFYGHGGVSVVWGRRCDLATYDYNQLTSLVFLCHAARIRCSIQSAGIAGLRLSFWPRQAEGDFSQRHPNLEEAVEAFNKYLASDHRVRQPRRSQ